MRDDPAAAERMSLLLSEGLEFGGAILNFRNASTEGWMERLGERGEAAVAVGRSRVPDGPPRWGELRRVEELPRTLPVPGAPCGRMRRAAEEGLEFRFPHRLLLDRRVFARRRRLLGGSVLVDASASMKLEPKDLLAIVAAAPGAEVACYEGTAEGWGVVRVLARDGRRVADSLVDPPLGKGANVIDGPALRWLATRRRPRIWVSDGHVRGVGDRAAVELDLDAQRICASGGILRVPDSAAARAALRDGRAASPPAPPSGPIAERRKEAGDETPF